jgi:hypothetical protein
VTSFLISCSIGKTIQIPLAKRADLVFFLTLEKVSRIISSNIRENVASIAGN